MTTNIQYISLQEHSVKGERRIRQPQHLVGLVPVVLQLLLEHLRLAVADLNRADGVVRLLEPNRTVSDVLTCARH